MLFAGYPDPSLLPRVRTDRGAIRFVLSGANIMCPGLTHVNAFLKDDLEAGDYVVSAHGIFFWRLFLSLCLYIDLRFYPVPFGPPLNQCQ